MTNLQRILKRIDRERLVRLLAAAVDAYSPSDAEMPATDIFAAALKLADIDYRRQPVPARAGGDPARSNLLIRLGPEPLALLWVGHVDTVALWYEGEYRSRIEHGRLYGLGSADMKSGCAAIVEALIAVMQSGLPLKRGLGVALVVGEEEYGDGSRALPDALRAPVVVIGEPTDLRPCAAHYGYLECRLEGRGSRAHAALPEVGANAIHAMLGWMLQIIDECQRLPDGAAIAVNPREIYGGEPGFVVAEYCEAMIDFHLPPGMDQADISQVIRTAREQVLGSHPTVTLDYRHQFWSAGFAPDPETAPFGGLKRAFRHCGLSWEPATFRSHSDAGIFHSAGMLPLVCGPGSLSSAHRSGEYVDLAEIEAAARLYAAMIYEMCIN